VKDGLTWDELFLRGASFLASQGVEDARLEAQSLLCYHLGWSRSELYARSRERAASELEAGFWRLIRRRGRREPTAYIQRHREFFGLDLYVDPRVLIPRPESELLVEEALKLAAGYPPAEPLLLADIGTGSGAIAISLALNLPRSEIFATDVSPGALEVAALNCRRHGVENRVHLLWGDMLEPLPHPCHIIVANLPYIPRQELDQLGPEVAAFEPRGALDGGEDGLDPVRAFMAQVGPRLRPGDSFLLEVGQGQGGRARQLVRGCFPTAQVALLLDLGGIERVLRVTLGSAPRLEVA
jgi:release factor glutamine methyltransferase